MKTKFADANLHEENVELDAQIAASIWCPEDGIIHRLTAAGVHPIQSMLRGLWYCDYTNTHPDYKTAVDARTTEILAAKGGEFTEDVELDAQLLSLCGEDNPDFIAGAAKLGIADPETGLKRGIWLIERSETHPEYQQAVMNRLIEILAAKSTTLEEHASKGSVKTESTDDGISVEVSTRIPMKDEQEEMEALKELGIDPTPEALKFVNKLADAAIAGAPLAEPYLQAGAIIIYKNALAPNVTAKAVGFHKTKLAEMINNPSRVYN